MPGIFSLNQLFAEKVREQPDSQVLCIPDKNFNYIKYTTSELDAAASLLANHLKDTGVLPGRAKGDATSRLTVGLLGVGNVDYIITELALFRMGYCVLFLSPNNSPPAIAHLLAATNASYMIVQDTLLSSATEALAHLPDPCSVTIIPQPPSETFGSDARVAHPDKTRWDPPLSPEDEHLLPVFIMHSSGSTGFPKPIMTTNRAAVGQSSVNFGLAGLVSLTTLPLYHTYGQSNMLRAWCSAKPLYFFPTALIPLTSANIIKLLSQVPDMEAFHGVPLAFKLLAESPEGLQILKRLKMVFFCGSPCPDELGDYLVSEGVPLIGCYGLTEMGHLLTSFRDFETDKEWKWMRAKGPYVRNGVHDYLRFEPRGDDTYELYVLDGWHSKSMTNQPDGSYATRDLFIKHPTIPDAYKYMGRIDDTIVLVNGEKINPVPIELTLRASPYIADAIVFGSGRDQIGALILPTDATQHYSREEFVQRLASVIALANADAPSHSQLSAEALVFLPFGTTIPRADKGSILRQKVDNKFERVIEDMYIQLEGEMEMKGKRCIRGEEEARVIVRDVIGRTIERLIDGLEDDGDLFDFGLDSLQSTRVRNAIQREINLNGKKLSTNAVFDHPSITKLAKFIMSLSSGKDSVDLKITPQKVMLELVEKYGQFSYPTEVLTNGAVDVHEDRSRKVVVLTGATGSLGAFILYELLADPEVMTIYCLCRAENDVEAMNRLVTSVNARMLTKHVKLDERVVALASDLTSVRFGLDEERYREMANRVTIIIHTAWAVNFNLGISSFETHIRGTVNLIHLGLSSPNPERSKFFFASSISAVANWPGPEPVPETVMEDPAVAQEMGYAQSKWVMENLCKIAALQTPMQVAILRIGQMVGDSRNGIWNVCESIPLIFKCADIIGMLPELDEAVSWLPVDCAAKSIVELVNLSRTPTDECPVYHIVHPTQVPWSIILDALKRAHVLFKRVPRCDWLEALRTSDLDERRNPSRKLLTFYQDRYGAEHERSETKLCVDRTVELSPSLREAHVVGEELVAKWVGAWRESGFLRCARHGDRRDVLSIKD